MALWCAFGFMACMWMAVVYATAYRQGVDAGVEHGAKAMWQTPRAAIALLLLGVVFAITMIATN